MLLNTHVPLFPSFSHLFASSFLLFTPPLLPHFPLTDRPIDVDIIPLMQYCCGAVVVYFQFIRSSTNCDFILISVCSRNKIYIGFLLFFFVWVFFLIRSFPYADMEKRNLNKNHMRCSIIISLNFWIIPMDFVQTTHTHTQTRNNHRTEEVKTRKIKETERVAHVIGVRVIVSTFCIL